MVLDITLLYLKRVHRGLWFAPESLSTIGQSEMEYSVAQFRAFTLAKMGQWDRSRRITTTAREQRRTPKIIKLCARLLLLSWRWRVSLYYYLILFFFSGRASNEFYIAGWPAAAFLLVNCCVSIIAPFAQGVQKHRTGWRNLIDECRQRSMGWEWSGRHVRIFCGHGIG